MENKEMVKVVFQRKESMVLWSTTFLIYIDNKLETFIRNGQTSEVLIPKGSHEIKIKCKALAGGKSLTVLIDTADEVSRVFDFSSNKAYINLSTKVGWKNSIEIDNIIFDSSINQEINSKKVNVCFKINNNEYMQKRLNMINTNTHDDTYVGIVIDGRNYTLVKNLENTEIEVIEGQHKVTIINPFDGDICDEKFIDFSKDNINIYLDLSPKLLDENSYRYQCIINNIEV